MKTLIKALAPLSALSSRLGFLFQALTRITLGMVFAQSGWGKLHHLEKVTQFFASIGIPFAKAQAPFVATLELLCGILVFLGLGTRLAATLLFFIMLVALRTAKWDDVTGLSALFELSEFLYALLLGWLITHGAGKLSLDCLLAKRFGARKSR